MINVESTGTQKMSGVLSESTYGQQEVADIMLVGKNL